MCVYKVVTQRWQTDWDNRTKAAITKQLFPNVRDSSKMNISITPNFTAMVTGHGRTRAYRHRFRLIRVYHSTCPWNKEDQTVDHLIHRCTFIIIGIQPLGRSGHRPQFSQATGIALVRCILGKFLGAACHWFPPLFRCSHFPRPPWRERSQRRKWELWGENVFR